MNRFSQFLLVLLCISVTFNIFLYTTPPSLNPESDIAEAITSPENQTRANQKDVSAKYTGSSDLSSPTEANSGVSARIPDLTIELDETTRQEWISRTEQWLLAGEIVKARDFIQRYLQRYPRDVEFLLLEADLIDKTAHISETLAHYYSVLDLPLNEAQIIYVRERIKAIVQENVDKLRQIRSWDILATFVEPLWQFAPTNRHYILLLSEAYARQQMPSLMEYVLASILPDDPDAVRIRRLIRSDIKIAKEETEEAVDATQFDRAIDLTRRGDHFVVSATLNNRKMNLMIDTGASTTVLTQKAFSKLRTGRFNSDFIGEYLVNTAGGQIKAPIYRLRSMAIADYRIKDIAVVVLPMEEFSQADGLLGMNFLREFDFRIDQLRALLFLTSLKK